jgi:hypothetical protein
LEVTIMVNRIIIIILLFTSFTFAQQAQHLKADTTYIHGVLRFLGTGLTFQDIATGTNTTATMTVGTGGTITYSGTGVVNANQFKGVTSVDATEFGYLNSERISNYVGSNLMLRSNVIEENATNGNAEIAMNYAGYLSSTTQFRDVGIYDGKNALIAFFDGSTKTTDLYGDLDMNGYDIHFTSSSMITSSGPIDLRPANGEALSIGYNVGSVDLINYGGSTSVKFQSYANGNVYAAGTGDFTAYKVNGSVGTAGQAIVSNGTTGGVWGTVTVANDTANMVTKATQQVITGIKRFANDIYLAGDKYIYGVSDLNLRGSGTGAVSINYGSGTDLIMYGGGTSAVFTVQETGAVYTASTVDATAYKVGGSVGTSGQILISNGSTGAVWTTGGSTVTFNGVHEASSGNDYVLVFTNGRLTSYSLYTP